MKQQAKANLLAALDATEQDVRHTSALVVAKVAAIEIPKGMWQELIPLLLKNSDNQAPVGVRHASLEALGYICEELGLLEEDYLKDEEVNAILTGVVGAMRPEESVMEIRYAATVALNNALEFASNNFEREAERNYIMESICHATIAESPKVRQAAWECLVGVAEQYYNNLPLYIEQLFVLTRDYAVKDAEEGVVLQALEFWSTIADEEIDRKIEEEDNPDSGVKSHRFIEQALGQLVPLLLEQLTKQDELADLEGAWNVSLAAGTALGLASNVAGNAIVPLVMPYIEANIQRNTTPEDWRYREAATFAFGCILDGPEVDALGEISRSALQFLLKSMADQNELVRNTTAWSVGRIFEFVHGRLSPPLLTKDNLGMVIETLLGSLADEIHIAEKVCYAISQLAAGFTDPVDSPLSTYFSLIVGKLLETSSRPVSDVGEAAKIQVQAFEAINEVVNASSNDAVGQVAMLIPEVTNRIGQFSSYTPSSPEQAEHQAETLSLLCGVINVVLTKLSLVDENANLARDKADVIMQSLLTVLSSRPNHVSEDAMLAVGALTYVTGKDFIKYMDAFFPYLQKGLQQVREWQTCLVTLGVLGDVCRALEESIGRYCADIMNVLKQNLENPEVPRSVKPSILASFGDIALAIGDLFTNYLAVAMPMLLSAASLSDNLAREVCDEDVEQIEYINSLRQNILEAWSGIFNGLSKENTVQYLGPHAMTLIGHIENILSDSASHRDMNVLSRTIDAIGDIASTLPQSGQIFRQKPIIAHFLESCTKTPGLDDKANWARTVVAQASVA